MFSTETSLITAAKQQYKYKLKSYVNLFYTLIGVQGIAFLFSLGGTGGMSSTFGNTITVSLKNYSGDILITFTFFWAFIVAYLLTTKEYRDMDFTFVSNRLSSNLANIVFLITANILGGLTAILGGVLLRVIVFFNVGSTNILRENFFISPGYLLSGFILTGLYLLLLSSIGYLCGVLVQLNRVFLVVLPGLFFGTLILAGRGNQLETVFKVVHFITQESSLPIFAIKIILVVGLLFTAASLLSDKLEVRK